MAVWKFLYYRSKGKLFNTLIHWLKSHESTYNTANCSCDLHTPELLVRLEIFRIILLQSRNYFLICAISEVSEELRSLWNFQWDASIWLVLNFCNTAQKIFPRNLILMSHSLTKASKSKQNWIEQNFIILSLKIHFK